MTITFAKASKERCKLRIGLDGPAKSGKTWTALVIATACIQKWGGRIALIDTERESASKYGDIFDFDCVNLDSFSPDVFIEAIKVATAAGYTVLVVDSLSHEWMGTDGILQQVEAAPDKNRFAAWRLPSLKHQRLIDALLQAPLHVVCTMRSKMAYSEEDDPARPGKKRIVKLGLQPVQREGIEYEFDILFSLSHEHDCVVTGSRCPEMPSGKASNCPGTEFFQPMLDWVSTGKEAPKPDTPSVGESKTISPAPKVKVSRIEPAKGLPPTARNMNDFYREAIETFGFPDKKAVVDALTRILGTNVLQAQREGKTMSDLWALLMADNQASLLKT